MVYEREEMTGKTGGSAFPLFDGSAHYGGLTKREYYAAAALQGLLASTQVHIEMDVSKIAGHAFDIADAMIEHGNIVDEWTP